MKRLFLKMTAAAAVGALLGACGGTDDGDDVSPGTLIDVAFRSGEISALVAAARRAGMEEQLSAADANLTVLAPTNGAWRLLASQLGQETIEDLLNFLPPEAVREILQYHVLPTRLSKAELRAGASQDTLLVRGGATVALPLAIVEDDLEITDMIGRIGIVNLYDVPTDNGVFHVVDRVLLPAGLLTVLQTLQSNPERFGSFVQMALSVPPTEGTSPPTNPVREALGGAVVTVFAPAKQALTDPFKDLATVLPAPTHEQRSTIVLYHLLGSELRSAAFAPGTPIATQAGQNITIVAGPQIDDTSEINASFTQLDIVATNGVVHAIDKVLMPVL